MNKDVKDFIEKNIATIEREDWKQLFANILSNQHYQFVLPDIVKTLQGAGIQPFSDEILDLIPVKYFYKILEILEDICPEAKSGDFASQIGWNDSIAARLTNIPAKVVAKLALELGFKVYETPDTWVGYDPKHLDYVIINPRSKLTDWFEEYYYNDEPEKEFDPSFYKEVKSL